MDEYTIYVKSTESNYQPLPLANLTLEQVRQVVDLVNKLAGTQWTVGEED